MSHSSGIPVSSTLKEVFGKAILEASVRVIKASIEQGTILKDRKLTQKKYEDQIVVSKTVEKQKSFEEDLELVPSLLAADQCSYVIVRTDSEPTKFVLFSYSPDPAKVREKSKWTVFKPNTHLHSDVRLHTVKSKNAIRSRVFCRRNFRYNTCG